MPFPSCIRLGSTASPLQAETDPEWGSLHITIALATHDWCWASVLADACQAAGWSLSDSSAKRLQLLALESSGESISLISSQWYAGISTYSPALQPCLRLNAALLATSNSEP